MVICDCKDSESCPRLRFWKEFIELEPLIERREKLKQLPFFKDLFKLLSIKNIESDETKSVLVYTIESYVLSYLNDLEEYLNKKG